MGLRVFEKSVHRRPVLALYKSLLKLSSSKTLDRELSGRLQAQIRQRFRKNKKWFSARLVKGWLVDAFNRHAQLERALNGSAPDLEALYSLTGLRRQPPPLPPRPPVVPPAEQLIPPPRPPPPTKGHVPNVYRAPTIHFSQYGIPVFVPPVVKESRKTQYQATSKIKQFRRYSETLSLWLSYQYHATFEEQFLRNIASTYSLRQGMNIEAGRREVHGMVSLIRRAMANMAWVEDVRVEKQIKDWVMMHPGATFRRYGQTMTKARKKELKTWEAEVRRIKKKIQMEREKARFMKKWEKQWGSTPLIPFIHPRQRRLKYVARKKRKVRMGHPERVLKRNA